MATGVHDACFDRNLLSDLSRCCKEGLTEELGKIFDSEKDIHKYFNVKLQRGQTLLHEACEADQANAVQVILLNGIPPDIPGKGNVTPLHVSAMKGYVNCVRMLLEADADIRWEDELGCTVFQKAERSKRREAVLRLLRSKELIYHTKSGNIAALENCLTTSQFRTYESRDISEALLVAVRYRVDSAIPLLVVGGAQLLPLSLPWLNASIESALILAIQQENIIAIAYLLLCKASLNSNEAQTIRSLLCEPPQEGSHVPCYIGEVFKLFAGGKMKMDYHIAISILAKNYEATLELLLQTDVDLNRRQVNWGGRKLTILHSSWIYSIAPWVVGLKLNNNHIKKLPKELFDASQLRRLDLSENILPKVPEQLFALPSLEYLNLSQNKIMELPPVPKWSVMLQFLDLSCNQLSSLPSSIQYSHIETLILSKNQFRMVPKCICRMQTLTSLDISSMPNITNLPKEMGQLPNLVTLNLNEAQILDFPAMLLRGGISGHFRARARASKPCSNIRVVVLGNSDHGREYLYQKLRHSSGSSSLQNTEKVEMISWHFKPLFNKGKFIGNQKLFFNMWLLPGGMQAYSLYPCFFTSSALYLLFWDLDSISGLREHLRPLLMQLLRYCPGANVAIIMVINEGISEQFLDQRTKTLEKYLSMSMFSGLHFHHIVLLTPPHHTLGHHAVQSDVKQRIYDIAINMMWNGSPLVSRQYPETYQLIATAVEKETKRPHRSFVMREHELWTISQAVVPNDPPDHMELPLIVEYLLHTGTILHFPDPNCELDQLYILSPAWLMDVLILITNATAVNRPTTTRRSSLSATYVDICHHPICSKATITSILAGTMKKEYVAPFYRILNRFSIALPISNTQLLIPSLLGRGTFSHNGSYQVGCLRRQLAPKAKALPPDMWPRILARILYHLTYITSIYPENTAIESAASPTLTHDSSITSMSEMRSNSCILIPHSGNLPATLITRVRSATKDQETVEENLPATGSPSPQEASIGSRYSAVFRFSMDEGKSPSEDREGDRPFEFPDTGNTIEDEQDTSFNDSILSLETSDNLQVWSNGIIYENKSFSFLLNACQSDVSSVEEKGIEIAVSRSKHGTLLLARLCYIVKQMIEEWFPSFMSSESQNQELTQLALCPQCINEGRSGMTTYLVDACVHSMTEGDTCINCRNHPNTVSLSELVPDYMMLDFPLSYHLNDLSIKTKDDPLHSSPHHKLFSGSYRNLDNIAIKQYTVVKQAVAEPLLKLRQEAVMLSQLKHPNIVIMYGFSVLQHCIVIEKAPLNTLHSRLTDYDEKISRVLRFHIACQVASALMYLHHHKIVYRTLKASSILLWSMDLKYDVTVKLTNFNRACFLAPTGHLGRNNFEAYHAPEMLKCNFKEEYTAKVDIYSYGLLLYELVTRWAAFEGSLLPDRLVVNQRPKLACINTAGYGTLVDMMQQCWQDDIQARPEAFSLVKQLRPLEFQCFLCSQVVRDCVSVRGCCLASSSRQIWVYGEDESGTQVFILNDEDLSIRGTLHLKARATSICSIDNKVIIGLTENCAHAYDAATFRFTDRLSLQDSVSAIAANDTFVFVGLANGVLIYYSKLQFPREPHEILIHNAPIFSMVAISDHMWLTCGNKIFILNADDSVVVAKKWDGCPQSDEVYSIAVSENQALVWSITRDGCCVMSWDVNSCECLHKLDLTEKLTTIFDTIHLSASYTRQLLCIERSKDTLWFGLSCGVIAIFTATKQPELIAFFRAHRSSSKCLKAIHCANERRGISSMMISGGFGEMSSLGTYISQKHGYVMLWEALSASEYKLLERRSREV